MHGNKGAITAESDKRCGSPVSSRAVLTALALALNAVPGIARVDEGGISFWTPGTYGSLVAVPQQAPGWSLTTIFWHDSVSAGADVARAREFELGRIQGNVTANVSNFNAEHPSSAGPLSF